MGKSITISVQSDHKPNPKANIFIRNIAPSVTQKTLFDIYSKYGNIIKCKLDCYNDGTSRGICYVQYEKEKEAKEAISKTHDLELEGKKLEVFPHEKRSNKPEEQKVEKSEKITNNVFVQGLPKGIDKAGLEKLFEEFGEITSAVVSKNGSDELLANTGYVCFRESSSASEAIKKLNKQKQPDNTFLFVSPHISKRDNELTSDKSKQPINQNMIRNLNSCIFVRQIPVETTEEEIRLVFSPYGNILSIKLKRKVGSISRFMSASILFEDVNSCQEAIRKLHETRVFGNDPINV